MRLEEAVTLLKNRHFSGAYCLFGYVAECKLKACTAKKTEQYSFPPKDTNRDFYTHDIDVLLTSSKLKDKLIRDMSNNKTLKANWKIVTDWVQESRYAIKSREEAYSIFQAVTNEQEGVLQRIKRHW